MCWDDCFLTELVGLRDSRDILQRFCWSELDCCGDLTPMDSVQCTFSGKADCKKSHRRGMSTWSLDLWMVGRHHLFLLCWFPSSSAHCRDFWTTGERRVSLLTMINESFFGVGLLQESCFSSPWAIPFSGHMTKFAEAGQGGASDHSLPQGLRKKNRCCGSSTHWVDLD